MKLFHTSLVLSTLLCAPIVLAQSPLMDHGTPAPGYKALASPAMSITMQAAGGRSANLYYNAPSARGRVIFGNVVPYGEVWRTGANPATTLVSNATLKIGTLTVPPGVHTIYTLPAAPGTPWQLIISNQYAQWGTVYKQDMDLGRTPMMAAPVSAPQDLMSITFEKMKAGAGELHIRWSGVDEYVPVSVQ